MPNPLSIQNPDIIYRDRPLAGIAGAGRPVGNSAGDLFSQLFGTATPQFTPQGPMRGNAPPPAFHVGQGGQMNLGAPTQNPGLPPVQAGVAQSAAPGLQNGNPANGFEGDVRSGQGTPPIIPPPQAPFRQDLQDASTLQGIQGLLGTDPNAAEILRGILGGGQPQQNRQAPANPFTPPDTGAFGGITPPTGTRRTAAEGAPTTGARTGVEEFNAQRRAELDAQQQAEGRTGGHYDLTGRWIPDTGGGAAGGTLAAGQEADPLAAAAVAAPASGAPLASSTQLQSPSTFDPTRPWQDPADSRSFQEQFGQARPRNWENWTQQQRENWKRNHFIPVQTPTTQGPPGGDFSNVLPPDLVNFDTTGDVTGLDQGQGGFQQNADAHGIPGTFDLEGFVNQGGQYLRFDDPEVDWNNIINSFGGNEELLFEYIQNSGDNWTQGFWANAMGVHRPGRFPDLPPPSQVGELGLSFSGTEAPQGLGIVGSPDYIQNQGIRRLVDFAFELGSKIETALAIGGGEAGDRDDSIRKWQEQLSLAQVALEQYGITYDPRTGDSTQPGGDPGNIFSDPIGGLDDDQVFTGRINFANPGLVPPEVARLIESGDPEARQAGIELANQIFQERNSRLAQQAGMNIQNDIISQFQNNPLFGQIGDIAQQLIAAGGPDFDAIRNQASATQSNNLNQLTQQLSNAAAARGATAQDSAGLQNEANRAGARDLAAILGDIDLAESASERGILQQNLGAATGAFGATAGPLSQLQQQLVGLRINQPTPGVNPAAGAFDFATGLSALDLSRQGMQLGQQNADNAQLLGILNAIGGQQGLGAAGAQLGGAAANTFGGLFGLLGLA